MSQPDLMALAEEERSDLLALLRSLTDEQWNAQSLCTLWRVRDVATHVVSYDELSAPSLVGTFVRGGLRVSGVNAVALRRYGDLEPPAIIDLLARNLRPSGLPSGFGGGIALTDGTIHHQDIRRALELPRTIPARQEEHQRPIADRHRRRLDLRRRPRSQWPWGSLADVDGRPPARTRRADRSRAVDVASASRFPLDLNERAKPRDPALPRRGDAP